MNAAAVRTLVLELRSLVETLGRDEARHAGPVVVSGMLAEQLARELGAGAAPGAVVVGGGEQPGPAEVAVHVIAGEATETDLAYVDAADGAGVPVVLVQLWPQEDRTEPFVLTPFVVECRAGQGFPVDRIAGRIVEAAERAAALGARIPVLNAAVSSSLLRHAAVRAGLLGAFGRGRGTRAVLTLEHARLVAQLQALAPASGARTGVPPVLAATAVAVLGTGFALRGAARSLRGIVPAPLAHAAVAAAGTWALGRAASVVHERLSEPS